MLKRKKEFLPNPFTGEPPLIERAMYFPFAIYMYQYVGKGHSVFANSIPQLRRKWNRYVKRTNKMLNHECYRGATFKF